jgi:hypothetical protein
VRGSVRLNAAVLGGIVAIAAPAEGAGQIEDPARKPLAVAQATTTAPAAGQEGSLGVQKPPPEELVPRVLPTVKVFYGWQIVAIGEAGGLVAAAAVVLPSSQISSPLATFAFLLGMPAYVLGGPVVHWSHGAFEKGLLSLGANVIGPVVAGLVGSGIRCRPADAPSSCGTIGFLNGLAVAVVTVPLLDAFALGWEDEQIDDPPTGQTRPPRGLAVEPLFRVGQGSVAIGLGGRF